MADRPKGSKLDGSKGEAGMGKEETAEVYWSQNVAADRDQHLHNEKRFVWPRGTGGEENCGGRSSWIWLYECVFVWMFMYEHLGLVLIWQDYQLKSGCVCILSCERLLTARNPCVWSQVSLHLRGEKKRWELKMRKRGWVGREKCRV